jgi:hypothetical protein
MAKVTRKRTILAKIESTYGTDPVPTGSANAILLRNLTVTPQENETVARDLVRTYLGNSPNLPVAINAAIEFEVELAGAGALGTVPAYGPLLRACAMSQTVNAGVSVVYQPVTDNIESVTIYLNADGKLHKLLGARGSVSLEIKAKTIPVMKFKFKGVYVPVTDTAPPTPVFTAWQQPKPVNGVFTGSLSIHGFTTAVMAELTLDLANNVVFRSLVGAESVLITDRKPAGQLMIESTSIAEKDWFDIARNATTGALSIVQGNTAGNRVQIDAPAVQILPPSYQDSDGVEMLSMGLIVSPNAGNDELVITVR